MVHHHHHHHAGPQPLPGAPAAAVTTTATAAPPFVFPPGVAVGRAWGEPLACAVLTLVCFLSTLRRLSITVNDWGVAARSMVWAMLAFALLAYVVIGTGTALAEVLAPSAPYTPPWVLAVLLEAVALLLASGLGGVGLAYYFRGRVRRAGGSGPIRGTHVFDGGRWQVNTAKARAQIEKDGKQTPAVRFAGCGIDFTDETKHFLALGTTGAGKSTAIRQLLGDAMARRDRAIIADPDGGYLARFYDPARGDIILNPLDARSARWSPIEDAPSAYLADELARALIPDLSQSDSQWTSYARTLLASILRQARPAGLTDAAEIHQLIVSAPLEELRMLLAGTAAAPFLAAGSEKLFAGTRSTASDAVAGLEYVAQGPADGTLFSVMAWAKSNRPGWLFLPYQADQIAALKRLIAAWMRLAIFATMSRGEGDSRTWFVVDELDALGKIDGLADALQRLRKFGGRCVIGFQSVGPLSSIYGDGIAAALIENTGAKLILRCSASEGGGTAAFASQIIGKRDVWRASSNTGVSSQTHVQGLSSGRSSGSTSSIVTEDAVLATQIENLPDLTGYLTTPSVAGWAKVRFGYDGLQKRYPAFTPFLRKR